MKKVILCLFALGIVDFLGCFSGTGIPKNASFPEISNDDYSTLYMFRERRLYGFVTAEPIYLNGRYLFRIGDGDCITFKIPTGPSEIVFVPEWKQLKFASERGKKYYFYLQVESGKSDFRQLTEKEWNEKQKACHWVKLKRKKWD